jgi:hypothetical protein
VPRGVTQNTRARQFIYRAMNFSTDNQKIKIATLAFLAGILVAYIFFPKTESETVYKFETVTKTDTLFITSTNTVYIPKKEIKTQVIRDTVLIDYKPKISQFNASFPFEYGSTNVSGEVLGEVLKMTATSDFKIPVVTNTITNTETKTIVQKPKGIYLGASVNSLLQPGAKVSYLDNKYLFGYKYQPLQKLHTLSVSKKIF